MQNIYPNLSIGNHVDAYACLQWEATSISMVLDLTIDLPTRKWHRNKVVTLRKVGFAEGKAIQTTKLKKALKFIQEERSQNKHVLVVCKDGVSRAKLIGYAYLMMSKNLSKEEALDRVGGLDEVPLKAVESIYKIVDKSARKEVNEVLCGG